jgi:hypothetical protein
VAQFVVQAGRAFGRVFPPFNKVQERTSVGELDPACRGWPKDANAKVIYLELHFRYI